MQWTVIENQNESSELLHYGVKGMKWGVRKERETSRTRSSSGTITGEPDKNPRVVSKKEFEKGAGLSSTPKQAQKTSKIQQANSMYQRAKEELQNDKAFVEWLKKNDKYDIYLDNITKFESWKNSGPIGMLTQQSSAIQAATDAYDVFVQYDQDPSAHSTEEEKELQNKKIEMANALHKALDDANVELRDIQEIRLIGPVEVNGKKTYVYTYRDADGKTYKAYENQLSTLISKVKSDSEKLKDFRNTSVGKRTREKHIEDSTPKIIKKYERTDAGKESEKKEQVGAKTTYLATKDAKNKAIKSARIQGSLERISNSTEIFNKQLSKIQSSGKKAAQSSSVKKTMKQTISETMKSAGSSMKKAAQFVSDFLKNPLNIQTNTTITTTTLVQKKK